MKSLLDTDVVSGSPESTKGPVTAHKGHSNSVNGQELPNIAGEDAYVKSNTTFIACDLDALPVMPSQSTNPEEIGTQSTSTSILDTHPYDRFTHTRLRQVRTRPPNTTAIATNPRT
jgi:hypothetical protein